MSIIELRRGCYSLLDKTDELRRQYLLDIAIVGDKRYRAIFREFKKTQRLIPEAPWPLELKSRKKLKDKISELYNNLHNLGAQLGVKPTTQDCKTLRQRLFQVFSEIFILRERIEEDKKDVFFGEVSYHTLWEMFKRHKKICTRLEYPKMFHNREVIEAKKLEFNGLAQEFAFAYEHRG